MNTSHTHRRIPCNPFACLLLLAGFLAIGSAVANTVQWTGDGDGVTWSDANNWFDLDDLEARVPGAADTVLFDSSASLPSGLQDINLTSDASVNDIVLQGTGDHAFRVSSNNASKLTLNEATAVKILVNQNATVNAEFDLEMNLLNGTVRDIRNRGTGTITLGANASFPGTYTLRLNDGPFQVNNATDSGRSLRILADAEVAVNRPDGLLAGVNRPELDVNGTLLIQSDLKSSEWNSGQGMMRLRGTGTAYIGAVGTADDVRFEIGRFEPDNVNNVLQIIANPDGSEGNLTLAVSRWNEDGVGRGSIATIAGSTVEIIGNMAANSTPAVTGAGNVLLNAPTAGDEVTIPRDLTHTGRTIVQSGRMIFDNETNGTVSPETVLEVGEDGAFVTMIPQTVSGLHGLNGTYGAVEINRGAARLIIDSADDSSFSGEISRGASTTAGRFVKDGSGTFTLGEGGHIFNIDGVDVEAGVFAIAGGRVEVAEFIAMDVTLGVTLLAGDVGETLLDISSVADITNSTLALGLGDGFNPALDDVFTLINSPVINGANVGGSIFQYTDGEEFMASGQLFRIDYIAANDSITLTAIPEPAAIWLALAILSLLGLRRLRRS